MSIPRDSTHPCPGGCGRLGVPRNRLACYDCWHRLPPHLRRRINYAWQHSAADHLAARAEAVSYWASENEPRLGDTP